jgi:indolepyruvate ferredoxin oxidoreductase
MGEQTARSGRHVRLEDAFDQEAGRAYITGMQALVRLPLEQHRRDTDQGLRTAGFISGYRGSPLGGYDTEIQRSHARLTAAGIRFEPGLNEELAATAVLGTQQASVFGGARQDGVFALWYGKGPGVDRSGDAFRHGVRAGAARHGGVLLAFGDDHPGKSSTVAHQSDPSIAALGIGVLYPATIQELIDFGLWGWAASRASGLWMGLKCVNETAEATGIVDFDRLPGRFAPPELGGIDQDALNTRMVFEPAGDEERHMGHRLPALAAFARANPIDRLIHGSPDAPFAIVSSGKAALDVVDALCLLGLGPDGPVAVYKVGLTYPIECAGLVAFARRRRHVLVCEEKAPFLEPQIARALYNLPADERPQLHGKFDSEGRRLLSESGVFDAAGLALVLARWLATCGQSGLEMVRNAAQLQATLTAASDAARGSPVRKAWFCAGCPHNRSTKTPEGSTSLTGIGCHTMALWMDRKALPPTQMGGEGANWIGLAPFVETGHVFQNLGDGTFNHSGILAIRAAVAARASITFQILFNDAVAMTGGQAHDGRLTVADVVRQVMAEKVDRVEVVAADPDTITGGPLPQGLTAHHRDALAKVQAELRDHGGVTVLVYDQGCAAVLRRLRKRGEAPTPARRLLINTAVCEGCGDCSAQSNCVAVTPVQTAFGVKRGIDQSGCNRDFSCLAGFCPSFVELDGATLAGSIGLPDTSAAESLPEPPVAGNGEANIVVAGIGGTGVVTVGALIGMAAHIEGASFAAYDMTGLAQKGGAVISHVRVFRDPGRHAGPRVPAGQADLLIGCEPQVAAGSEAIQTLAAGRSNVVLEEATTAPGEFQIGNPVAKDIEPYRTRIEALVGQPAVTTIPATGIARRLLGDAVYANVLLLGATAQLGRLPVGCAALEAAIRLNGASVEKNIAAFRLGRMLTAGIGLPGDPAAKPARPPQTLDAMIAHRTQHLAAYQDEAYAARFQMTVAHARDAAAGLDGGEAFVRAVVIGLSRLMAYKDEYEVARLYSDEGFKAQLTGTFADPGRVSVWLSPPLLSRPDPLTGRPRKIRFGPWIFPLLARLARLRHLRGRWYDPFGWAAERRMERQLIARYEARIRGLCEGLSERTLPIATQIAGLADEIRGFGPVKQAAVDRANRRESELLAELEKADSAPSAEALVETIPMERPVRTTV